jgi:hypothetical protein
MTEHSIFRFIWLRNAFRPGSLYLSSKDIIYVHMGIYSKGQIATLSRKAVVVAEKIVARIHRTRGNQPERVEWENEK